MQAAIVQLEGKGRQTHAHAHTHTHTHTLYLLIRPLNPNEVMEIDGISLSWFVLHPPLKVGAECIERGASKLHHLI